MRFLLTGDWHITDSTPKNRIDNYPEALFNKINWILETADRYDATVLQPGDLFDSPKISFDLFVKVFNLLTITTLNFIAVAGQHDLRYHTSIENSPIFALHQVSALHLLMGNSYCRHCTGAGWGEEIPKPTYNDDYPKILLTHRMIVDNKLWAEQEGHTFARNLLRKTEYDIIVSGDNHKFFIEEYKGKYLFNMGSLMRSNIGQIEHQPKVVIFNTYDKSYKVLDVPIEPAEKVFRLEKVEKQKEADEKIKAFVEGLQEDREIGLDFESNILSAIVKNKVPESIKQIILKAMEE